MLKTNTRTLTKKMQSQYKKNKRKFEIAQQVISNPPKPWIRSPMNRETSLVAPLRKQTSSKILYQKRFD